MADEGQVMSLKELQQENEAEEAAESKDEQAENQVEEQEEVGKEEPDEQESEESEESEESPAFMESDLDEGDAPALSDTEAGKIRRKYKSQATKAKDEADVLREENARLKAQQAAPVAAKVPGEPKRDDFKSDLLYLEARQDFKSEINEAWQQTAFTASKNKAAQDADAVAVGESVDEHYLRAEKLAGKSNITPEAYQAADQRVRNAVEAQVPGGGDAVVDKLIQTLGAGSERVFYHLGVNKSRLSQFITALGKDAGLSAMALLATLNADLKAPKKRVSKAPDPGEDVRGDTKVKPGDKKLREAYNKAGAGTQEAQDIRRKARAAGMDISNW